MVMEEGYSQMAELWKVIFSMISIIKRKISPHMIPAMKVLAG